MKIDKKILKLLNEQFYNELYAAHVYFGMSAYFKRTTYAGFAKWMELQAKEEMSHAMKIYDYMCERDMPFASDVIKKPSKDVYEGPLDAFKVALEHEQTVTAQVTKIFEEANDKKDWVTADLMNWFMKEQVEEEHSVQKFIRALVYAGNDKNLLIAVSDWAGKRAE